MNYTIDAQNKKLGRVASEAATILMGKNLTTFARNKAPEVKVHIINVSKIVMDLKKSNEKEYVTYSGFPGGIKHETMTHLKSRRGMSEVMRRAIDGMLPKNKLKAIMLKNLVISE